MVREVTVNNLKVGGENPLVLISGPCVIEDEQTVLMVAHTLKELTQATGISLIFKTSYDKANRTSLHSYRGPGLSSGLEIIKRVKDEVGIPVLSDVHCVREVEAAASVLDVIQIPAFLCRQTDLVLEVARTGKPVNVKKGQFLAPWDVEQILEKITSTGNEKILITERGTIFGYNNLVVDFRSLVIMRRCGFPIIFDATHSVQLPGGGETSRGDRQFVPYLAKAACAADVDGVFIEVHPDPDRALCDGPNSLRLSDLKGLLPYLKAIHNIIRKIRGSEAPGP